ncbi:hypothetical protein PSTH1771_26325 [Pseudomonas syringae pv. theae]|nr:hypothetical protein [Pseudomonas syringae]KPZ35010.1 hypothetical protein AN901_202795 [Pseudomonas syringae pv. theae]GKQ32649.1 hypothetical protein PSTH68_24040 [Pseudomonas syringae pv. theae]GKQ48200.1 hypothetical protein PSTH2693_23610 [Pseudomonas syringae pv. theae]GKS08603.1 hypothetical protein PSTH1771_26325 [Pseudomonas syringae pv. theae]
MNTFSLLTTPKIGEARGVPRISLEGQKLLNAGIEIGTRFSLMRLEGQTFNHVKSHFPTKIGIYQVRTVLGHHPLARYFIVRL